MSGATAAVLLLSISICLLWTAAADVQISNRRTPDMIAAMDQDILSWSKDSAIVPLERRAIILYVDPDLSLEAQQQWSVTNSEEQSGASFEVPETTKSLFEARFGAAGYDLILLHSVISTAKRQATLVSACQGAFPVNAAPPSSWLPGAKSCFEALLRQEQDKLRTAHGLAAGTIVELIYVDWSSKEATSRATADLSEHLVMRLLASSVLSSALLRSDGVFAVSGYKEHIRQLGGDPKQHPSEVSSPLARFVIDLTTHMFGWSPSSKGGVNYAWPVAFPEIEQVSPAVADVSADDDGMLLVRKL